MLADATYQMFGCRLLRQTHTPLIYAEISAFEAAAARLRAGPLSQLLLRSAAATPPSRHATLMRHTPRRRQLPPRRYHLSRCLRC